MTQSEFSQARQIAVDQMREMKNRSTKNEPQKSAPKPPQNSDFRAPVAQKSPAFVPPFLDSLLKDSDTTLILGLLLILMSEKSDKILLFALLYIML